MLLTARVSPPGGAPPYALVAAITPATLASMALRKGEEVFLTFKATCVRLFEG